MITVKTVFMSRLFIVYPKSLLGFGTNGADFLGVIIEGIGLVTLGSTKGTNPILKRCADLMKEIQDNPDADYLIDDDTFKEGNGESE
jgi:hypothetical protein